MLIISIEIMKTTGQEKCKNTSKEKQTKTERSKENRTEAIAKGWELNDSVELLSFVFSS